MDLSSDPPTEVLSPCDRLTTPDHWDTRGRFVSPCPTHALHEAAPQPQERASALELAALLDELAQLEAEAAHVAGAREALGMVPSPTALAVLCQPPSSASSTLPLCNGELGCAKGTGVTNPGPLAQRECPSRLGRISPVDSASSATGTESSEGVGAKVEVEGRGAARAGAGAGAGAEMTWAWTGARTVTRAGPGAEALAEVGAVAGARAGARRYDVAGLRIDSRGAKAEDTSEGSVDRERTLRDLDFELLKAEEEWRRVRSRAQQMQLCPSFPQSSGARAAVPNRCGPRSAAGHSSRPGVATIPMPLVAARHAHVRGGGVVVEEGGGCVGVGWGIVPMK